MSKRINHIKRSLVFQDLGILGYTRTLTLQTMIRGEKIKNSRQPDMLLFVQHSPVFTFGKNGGRENLMASEQLLKQHQVDVVQTDRGGNVTYHAPGQAVLYPIIDIERARIGVADFIHGLEDVMRIVAEKCGVTASRNSRNHGLWVGSSKIGSVGLSIKRGISMHGLAMNINPDLTPFSWINPCGMQNLSVTSIAKETAAHAPEKSSFAMDDIRDLFVSHFCNVFDFEIINEFNHV